MLSEKQTKYQDLSLWFDQTRDQTHNLLHITILTTMGQIWLKIIAVICCLK